MGEKVTPAAERIDKWLWASRLFKTRSIASEACKKGRIVINNMPVKPSHEIHVGDTIDVRRPPVTYSYLVVGLSENRVGAKLVPGLRRDITPASQLEILEMGRMATFARRDRGAGRPTKRERRKLVDYMEDGISGSELSVADFDGFGEEFFSDSAGEDEE